MWRIPAGERACLISPAGFARLCQRNINVQSGKIKTAGRHLRKLCRVKCIERYLGSQS